MYLTKEIDVDFDVDVEEIYESMSTDELNEMAGLLKDNELIKFDILKFDEINEEIIKEMVYYLRFNSLDKNLLDFLIKEVEYYRYH